MDVPTHSPSGCPTCARRQELDPEGKFAGSGKGAKNVWVFNARRGGAQVPFASCCTPKGFKPERVCASRGSCS